MGSRSYSLQIAGGVVSIAAASANKAEGSAGTTAFTFTVARTLLTSGDLTLNYAVSGSGGAAADASDFGGTLPSGTIVIPDTQTSATLTINVSADSLVEPDEAFTVTLTGTLSSAYSFGTTTANGVILNDDVVVVNNPPVIASASFTPASPLVGETVLFTVAATDPESAALTIGYNYGDGSSDNTGRHAYSTAGTYTVTVSVSDGVNNHDGDVDADGCGARSDGYAGGCGRRRIRRRHRNGAADGSQRQRVAAL